MSDKTQWEALLEELNGQQVALEKALKIDADDDAEPEEDTEAGSEKGGEDDEDATIEALADGDADDDGVPDNKDEDEDEDELFGKSFSVRTDDGEEMQAYDGTELVKSMLDRQAEVDLQLGGVTRHTGTILKALESALGAKDAEIKGLRKDLSVLQKAVVNLAGSGRGRKSAVTVHDRSDAAPDVDKQLTAGELLAKADGAAQAGRITWREYAGVDAALRMRHGIDDGLMARIKG